MVKKAKVEFLWYKAGDVVKDEDYQDSWSEFVSEEKEEVVEPVEVEKKAVKKTVKKK